jgi:hypothetical protein
MRVGMPDGAWTEESNAQLFKAAKNRRPPFKNSLTGDAGLCRCFAVQHDDDSNQSEKLALVRRTVSLPNFPLAPKTKKHSFYVLLIRKAVHYIHGVLPKLRRNPTAIFHDYNKIMHILQVK